MILKTTYIEEIKIGSIRDELKSYKWDFIPVEIILYSIFILIWVIQTWELMKKKWDVYSHSHNQILGKYHTISPLFDV